MRLALILATAAALVCCDLLLIGASIAWRWWRACRENRVIVVRPSSAAVNTGRVTLVHFPGTGRRRR